MEIVGNPWFQIYMFLLLMAMALAGKSVWKSPGKKDGKVSIMFNYQRAHGKKGRGSTVNDIHGTIETATNTGS